MKKIALFLLTISTLIACSANDDNPKYHFEVLPVESFTVPENFTLGETYSIKMKYKKLSDCHNFEGFYYEKDLNVRTIAIQSSILERSNCQSDTTKVEVSFNFKVTSNGSYIFKFYKGTDTSGNDLFNEVEIPVIN